ncbi:MAG: hypothetical protein ACOZAO_01250 [Patescibacteria group bacterium]
MAVFAQFDEHLPSGCEGCDAIEIGEILAVGVNLFMGIAISMSTLGMLYSGVKWVMSKGDPKAVANARTSLVYSIIGFILGIGALSLKVVVFNNIGDPGIDDVPNF